MTSTVDPYATVHKAVRHQLTAVLQQVSATDWADPGAAAAACDAVDAALDTQEQHATHEDSFYHPLLEAKVPGCTTPFVERHRQLADRITHLEATTAALRAAASVGEAEGYDLYLALGRFVGDYLLHLDDEETVLKPLFREHCSDEELGALEGEVVASTPPESMEALLPHFLAALDRAELVAWLGGMRAAAPPDAFAGILAAGEQVVPAGTWQRVVAALDGG